MSHPRVAHWIYTLSECAPKASLCACCPVFVQLLSGGHWLARLLAAALGLNLPYASQQQDHESPARGALVNLHVQRVRAALLVYLTPRGYLLHSFAVGCQILLTFSCYPVCRMPDLGASRAHIALCAHIAPCVLTSPCVFTSPCVLTSLSCVLTSLRVCSHYSVCRMLYLPAR